MSINEINVIDSVIESSESLESVLLITDHLDWNEPKKHMLVLQDKINAYIRFIESEQIYENFPNSKGKSLKIVVAAYYDLPEEGMVYYKNVNNFLSDNLNISIEFTKTK